MNKKFLLWLFINIIFINFARAIIPGSVDRSNITIGQSLTLTIDISKTNSDPDISILNKDFDVSGSSTSSQTSIVNGSVSSQKSFIVSISPKNAGKQVIPAIKVGNDTTAPIAINVTQQSISEQRAQKSQIFVDAKIINKTSYIGVPIVFSMKLYYSVNISNVNMSNIDIKGATIQPLGKSTGYSENIKGTDYRVLEQRFQITTNESGTITIPGIKITGATYENNNMDTSLFSMVRPRAFSVASMATNISIKPIPEGITADQWFPAKQVTISENQPNAATTLKLGQPITRTITIVATGVPDTSIPELHLVTPANVNAYPDKTVSNSTISDDDLLSTKVFKVAYIPTQAGTISFPETSVKWWDITSGILKTAVIPAKTYTILNENGKTITNITPATTNQNQPLVATNPITQVPRVSTLKDIWFYISIALAILWIITIIIAITLVRKKAVIVNDNNAVKEQLNNEKKAKELVVRACKDKNIAALNTALTKWATLHWQKKIYTVLDIKDLSTNNTLNKLIEEFNQTLYRGTNFEKFDALAHEIDMLGINKQTKNNEALKELYPQ